MFTCFVRYYVYVLYDNYQLNQHKTAQIRDIGGISFKKVPNNSTKSHHPHTRYTSCVIPFYFHPTLPLPSYPNYLYISTSLHSYLTINWRVFNAYTIPQHPTTHYNFTLYFSQYIFYIAFKLHLNYIYILSIIPFC